MNFFIQNHKKFLLLFFIFFAIIHFACSLFLAHHRTSYFLHHDGNEYLELAESYAEHGRLISEKARYYETPRNVPSPEAYRLQLVSISTGILIFFGLSPLTAAALFSAIVAVLLAIAVYKVSEKLTGCAFAGWISLLLFSFHPIFTQLTWQLCCEPLCALFLLYFFWLFINNPTFSKPCLMAICISGAAYSRASTFLLFPFIAIIAFVVGIKNSKGIQDCLKSAIVRNLVIFTLTACCIAFSVGVRNYLYFQSFSIAGFEGGFGFFHGNNRYTLKAMQAENWKEYLKMEDKSWDFTFSTIQKLPQKDFAGHPEKQSAYMFDLAIKELKNMTFSEKVILFARKFLHFIQPNPMTKGHHPLLYWGLTLYCSFLFLCGITGGIILWKKRKAEVWAFFSLMASGIIAYTIFMINMRYRIPYIDLACIILAGGISLKLPAIKNFILKHKIKFNRNTAGQQ